MAVEKLKVRSSYHSKRYKDKTYVSVQCYVTIPSNSNLRYKDEVIVMDVETAKDIANRLAPFAKWFDEEIDGRVIEFLKILGKWRCENADVF